LIQLHETAGISPLEIHLALFLPETFSFVRGYGLSKGRQPLVSPERKEGLLHGQDPQALSLNGG
jgi:hypothetical protein